MERQGDRAADRPRHRRRVRDRHLEAPSPDRSDHARLRLRQHRRHRVGDHLHRRRRGHPPLPRLRHRLAGRPGAPIVPRDRVPADLRFPPDRGAAQRVQRPDPQAHAAQGRREALLRRLPAGRAPDGDRRVGGQRARDLLPVEREPARSRARPPVDCPAAREAADGRGVRLQEVDRPAVPLPGQLARPDRELPPDDVCGSVGALPGEPDGRARVEAAVDPARRPRAELLDVDRPPRRLLRRQHLRVDRGGRRRVVGPAPRRRQRGRHPDAGRHPRQRRRRRARRSRARRTPTTTSVCPGSVTASTRTTTRGPASSARPRSACSTT